MVLTELTLPYIIRCNWSKYAARHTNQRKKGREHVGEGIDAQLDSKASIGAGGGRVVGRVRLKIAVGLYAQSRGRATSAEPQQRLR